MLLRAFNSCLSRIMRTNMNRMYDSYDMIVNDHISVGLVVGGVEGAF